MKFDKAPFDASGDYDARKSFVFQGTSVERGTRFDWRNLGVSGRKLRQLWDNGFIVPVGSALPTGIDPELRAKRQEAGRRAAEARKAKRALESA